MLKTNTKFYSKINGKQNIWQINNPLKNNNPSLQQPQQPSLTTPSIQTPTLKQTIYGTINLKKYKLNIKIYITK